MLFLCENNGYAMGTALERSEAQIDIHLKAQAQAVPAESVDGMDVLAVETAARRAADAVRRGDGPYLLELHTYRFRAHSMYDPELYRTKQEVEHWKERDPIVTFDARLRALGLLDDETRSGIDAEVEAELDAAVEEAEAAPFEPVEQLTRHVYAPGRA